MPDPFAPPAALLDGRRVVAPDVYAIAATLRFDVAAREATATATVDFSVETASDRPALDLRQPIDQVRLDGRPLDPESVAGTDLGAGPGSAMRVLPTPEAPGRHRLELRYRLGTPDAVGAEPIEWCDGGVRFDFWMSDLQPGRYLEMWVPAPLCHDRFALTLTVEVAGTDRPHGVVANAADMETVTPGSRWVLRYPPHFTSLSPMLVLVPADQAEVRASTVILAGRAKPVQLITARTLDVDADLAACEADIESWLVYLAARYGPWAHGDSFITFVWAPGRGMEYDAATTAAVPALEHEVFHSWFGRGVKPARASDGWIDEAWTSWATASRRVEEPRFAATELGLDEEPVLLCPPHGWSRYTPVEAYRQGSRLFAGIAHLVGGPDRLRSTMAAWYAANVGGLVTTEGLEAHFKAWSGVDVGPWWDRYVHGRG